MEKIHQSCLQKKRLIMKTEMDCLAHEAGEVMCVIVYDLSELQNISFILT